MRGYALSNSLFLFLFCILSSIKLLLQESKRIADLFHLRYHDCNPFVHYIVSLQKRITQVFVGQVV